VFIGDEYAVGSTILRVVSPRAPCAKINHRYGIKKLDLHIANYAITGWYYRVIQEGKISIGDEIILSHRQSQPLSVKQIWQLRQQLLPDESPHTLIALATRAYEDTNLAPQWQADMHRVSVKLAKKI
jgi:MOSC domain-containing protein YiiM